jgi:Raf kinase inhibitor-like YbhB/YbcL family protein
MEVKMMVQLRSTAFVEDSPIPDKYTCMGEDMSPPLSWTKGNADIRSWAIIADDQDAPKGGFTHWVIFNIPTSVTSFPEGVPKTGKLENGALQGTNSKQKMGYTGPCPPTGQAHHYNFTLYALSGMLKLPAGASKEQVTKAMKGHIVVQGNLVGVYQR